MDAVAERWSITDSGLTATGIAPDLHRLPFSWRAYANRYTAKIEATFSIPKTGYAHFLHTPAGYHAAYCKIPAGGHIKEPVACGIDIITKTVNLVEYVIGCAIDFYLPVAV